MAVSRVEFRSSRHCFAFYEIHVTTIVSLPLLRSLDTLRPSIPSAFLHDHHESAHRKTSLIRSIDTLSCGRSCSGHIIHQERLHRVACNHIHCILQQTCDTYSSGSDKQCR
jgi:hypothetical protein